MKKFSFKTNGVWGISTKNASMKTYLVGGAVRDTLLGYPYQEKDWVVVGSSPEAMARQGYTPVGKDFPVFIHPNTGEEYALARTERKVAPGYKGFTFHTDPSVSLEQDLKRRDLTINAMAMDDDGNLIDPYHGQKDLTEKRLRHVSPAFSEDPVRILRVARFAARYHQLGFTIATETLTLMQTMVAAGETQHIVAERMWQECFKALSERNPEIFFDVLQKCAALNDILPAITVKHIQTSRQYLLAATATHPLPLIRYAAWCYPMSAADIDKTCEHLATPKAYHKLARMAQQQYPFISTPDTWTADAFATLFLQTDAMRKNERFEKLLLVCEAIYAVENQGDFLQKEILKEALSIFDSIEPQTLIQQGYQGKALGEAIQTARAEKLHQWLCKHAKNESWQKNHD